MYMYFAVRNSEVSFEHLLFRQAAYTKHPAELILCECVLYVL